MRPREYRRLIPRQEIPEISIDKISQILSLKADKIRALYANNVVAHYEKYVLLYVRAMRRLKAEIDLIY